MFYDPLNDKAQKICNAFVLQHFCYCDLFFLAAQSTTFISKTPNRPSSKTNPQSSSCAQISSYAKIEENINPEYEHLIDQSTEFQKKCEVTKQFEELVEPYLARICEKSDIDLLKKGIHGDHTAYFSCTNLQLSLKTMQHSLSELQPAVTILKQVSILMALQNYYSKIKLFQKLTLVQIFLIDFWTTKTFMSHNSATFQILSLVTYQQKI